MYSKFNFKYYIEKKVALARIIAIYIKVLNMIYTGTSPGLIVKVIKVIVLLKALFSIKF